MIKWSRAIAPSTKLMWWLGMKKKLLMAELKFHNQIGEKSDLKVALYVKARFDDLSAQYFDYGRRRQLDEGWLITNTKFSSNAIRYGLCAKVAMIGWSYPAKGNLQDLIEDAHLHPITCLTSLTITEKQNLLQNGQRSQTSDRVQMGVFNQILKIAFS